MTDTALPNVGARVESPSPEARASLRKYERLLSGNLAALQGSPVSNHANHGALEELVGLATDLAQRGVRFSHQGSWTSGVMQPLDQSKPERLIQLDARHWRFVALPERDTGGAKPYLVANVGSVASPGAEPDGSDEAAMRRWNKRRGALVNLLTTLQVIYLDGNYTMGDARAWSAVALIVHKMGGELPPVRELPAGAKAIEERLRARFVAKQSCSYTPPKEWDA